MKKLIYFFIAFFAIYAVKVNALTNSGKIYEQYYQEAQVNVFASDERYHSLDYNGILVKSSADNEVYYCIEPEVKMPLYSEATYNSHTIYEGKTTIIKQCRLTDKNYDRVSLLAYYGYLYKDNKVDHTSKKWYGITQTLIWGTVRPDVTYVFKTSRYGNIDYNLYKNEVSELETLVSNHNKVPSFANDSFNLKKGEVLELVDTNNVLSSFNYSSNDIAKLEIKDNTLLITGLKDGEAKITFTKPKANYDFRLFKSSTVQNVVTRGNVDNPSFTINLKITSGDLTILKVDSEDEKYNEDLNGTLFNLYDSNDNLIKEIEINQEKETIELPFGNYYLKEISSSLSYKLNSQKYEFTIDDNNKEISIVIPNTKIKGELILEKYKGGLSEEFIKESDAKFEIYKDDILIDTITTDENGIAKITLEYGTYLVKQVKGSEGYSYVDNFYVSITEEKEYRYELKNIKKSALQITKLDYSSNNPIKDTTFEIYTTDDKLVYEGKTDTLGVLLVENLEIGKYYIKEKEAAKYYKLNDEKVYFEVKDNGEFIKLSITNERNTGTLKFLKVDSKSKEPLKDALIRITYLDTDEVLFLGKTDELGLIILENITAGSYKIEEVSAPYGYILNKEPITFSIIDDQEIVEVTMENEKIEMPNTFVSYDYLTIIIISFALLILTRIINLKNHEK